MIRSITLALACCGVVTSAHAADLEAGAELAQQCAACHGPAGVSVDDAYPNLAAQKQAYLAAQLKAFRAGERKNALMNAVAAGLDDADIDNVAAHFASLPGAEPGAVGEALAALSGQLLAFPADHAESLTRYQTISFPERKQVRFFKADAAALDAVKAGEDLPDGTFLLVEIHKAELGPDGQPVTGPDGEFVAGELTGFTAMEKRAGWGEAVPEVMRNGDWRYAVFTADGEPRSGVNEAPCLACHKPLTETDYTFTYEAMKAFAEAN